jgi:hypothetical protein
MSFLGMGALEIVVIFLIAFVLIGPDRMMEMTKKAGKLVRELRKMSEGLQEAIAMPELDDVDLIGTRNLTGTSPPVTTGTGRDIVDDGPVNFRPGGGSAADSDSDGDSGSGSGSERAEAAPEQGEPKERGSG